MSLNADTIARYQPGGDVYAKLVAQYGTPDANRIAFAARSGDGAALANAIEIVRGHGGERSESTLGLFATQIATDPLAAPLDALNKPLGAAVWSLLKNPWVLLAFGLVLFFWLGGSDFLRKRLKKLA